MYKLIDGKKLAADMRAQLKADVAEFKKEIGLDSGSLRATTPRLRSTSEIKSRRARKWA